MNEIEKLKEDYKSLETGYKSLGERIDKILAEQKTPKFEIGKWYKEGSALFNYRGVATSCFNEIRAFGLNYERGWSSLCDWYLKGDKEHLNALPATEEEIKTALVTEAEKRGFKVGAKIKRCADLIATPGYCLNSDAVNIFFLIWKYTPAGDSLTCDGKPIYAAGKWATILPDSVTIAGQEVTYNKGIVTINGGHYTKLDLLNMVEIFVFHPDIKSFNVGCTGQYKVVKEDIQLIIDKWPKY